MNDVDRALTDAVLRGSLKDVKRLLSAKPPNNANPNAQDVAHITPLMRAAQLGHVDIVKTLVEYGANLDERDVNSKTALHYACCISSGTSEQMTQLLPKRIEIVKFLVSRGADISLRDHHGLAADAVAQEQGIKDPYTSYLDGKQLAWFVKNTTVDIDPSKGLISATKSSRHSGGLFSCCVLL
ncbi:hypothetical protein Pelo_6825 [Pelomyxa schiedti]|nr:hypothetical protein Pelo_6825 [Pelomyxa schiedti]